MLHLSARGMTRARDGSIRVAGFSPPRGRSLVYGGKWTSLRLQDGLAGNEVKTMTRDRDGTFWLGSNSGLNRVEESALFPAGTDLKPGCNSAIHTGKNW